MLFVEIYRPHSVYHKVK